MKLTAEQLAKLEVDHRLNVVEYSDLIEMHDDAVVNSLHQAELDEWFNWKANNSDVVTV